MLRKITEAESSHEKLHNKFDYARTSTHIGHSHVQWAQLHQTPDCNTNHVSACSRTQSSSPCRDMRVPNLRTKAEKESIQCTRPVCRRQQQASTQSKSKTLWSLEVDPSDCSCLPIWDDLRTDFNCFLNARFRLQGGCEWLCACCTIVQSSQFVGDMILRHDESFFCFLTMLWGKSMLSGNSRALSSSRLERRHTEKIKEFYKCSEKTFQQPNATWNWFQIIKNSLNFKRIKEMEIFGACKRILFWRI